MKIIGDKNDNEFDIFYTNHMSKFKLKQYYFTRLFYKVLVLDYRCVNFNTFDNVNDFIEKVCTVVQDSNFYKELNTFLTDILEINQRLKKRGREKNRTCQKRRSLYLLLLHLLTFKTPTINPYNSYTFLIIFFFI